MKTAHEILGVYVNATESICKSTGSAMDKLEDLMRQKGYGNVFASMFPKTNTTGQLFGGDLGKHLTRHSEGRPATEAEMMQAHISLAKAHGKYKAGKLNCPICNGTGTVIKKIDICGLSIDSYENCSCI